MRLGARNRQDEVFADDILAGKRFLGAAALLLEDGACHISEHGARFVERAAVRVDAGQLLDEADVAAAGFEVDRAKGNHGLFQCRSFQWFASRRPRARLRSFVTSSAANAEPAIAGDVARIRDSPSMVSALNRRPR